MSAAASGPLTSFTIFPNLPFELRCMVWEASCVSRIVEIEHDEDRGFTARSFESDFTDNILMPPEPMALQVCRESREAVIQSYPLCFGSIFHQAKTRFNFAIDTLFIPAELEEQVPHFFSTFREQEIAGLQFLAFDSCFNEPAFILDFSLTRQLQNMVKKLPSLREILVVFDVVDLCDQELDCIDDHPLELHDKLPAKLEHPSVTFDALPEVEDDEEDLFNIWSVPKCRPVYGWRRCPNGDPFSNLQFADEMSSDGEHWGDRNGFMWGSPMGVRLGDMLGLDEEDEEDMFGYGEDNDEDEDDDEEAADDTMSIASVD